MHLSVQFPAASRSCRVVASDFVGGIPLKRPEAAAARQGGGAPRRFLRRAAVHTAGASGPSPLEGTKLSDQMPVTVQKADGRLTASPTRASARNTVWLVWKVLVSTELTVVGTEPVHSIRTLSRSTT